MRMPIFRESAMAIRVVCDYVDARYPAELHHCNVVVGYGTMKRSDLSGASVSMKEEDLKGSIITNLDQSLQGRAAEPIELVNFILFLASENGRSVTGSTHVMDCGRLAMQPA